MIDFLPEANRWPRYNILGITLSSDYPFRNWLPSTQSEFDLIFTCVDSAPIELPWEGATPVYKSPNFNQAGEHVFRFYRFPECAMMRYAGVADFFIYSNRVICQLADPSFQSLAGIHLLPAVVSYWLEQRGIPCFHASAVAVADRAFVFMANKGNGKSTLAAAFLQSGFCLITDDILPIERRDSQFYCRPSCPQMRLWPEEARLFSDCYEDLEEISPNYSKRRARIGGSAKGRFCERALPVKGIYILERYDPAARGGEVTVSSLPPREAFIHLVRFGYGSSLIDTAELTAHRMDMLAQLARELPVRRLRYPGGLAYLPAVREAVLKDAH